MRRSRLSAEEKVLIKKLREESKIPYKALAKEFGVSDATIMRICRPDIYAKHQAAAKIYNTVNSKEIYAQRKSSTKRYGFYLDQDQDTELIVHLDKQDNVSGYIRELIVKDMKK